MKMGMDVDNLEHEHNSVGSDDESDDFLTNELETRETSEDRIMYPSPRVSIEDNEAPIIVRNNINFEERVLEASPEASIPMELSPCDVCGRKFNQLALQRHVKVCQKVQSKPKKIFDAVNKLWKSDVEVEQEKQSRASKAPLKKKKSANSRPEDNYKTCDYCQRRFCENAFDRHVEFCKEKASRIATSPVKDIEAQVKLNARIKYNPKESQSSKKSLSPSRKASLTSLFSEASLPPWNFSNSFSGRNTPNRRSLTRQEGNMRASKRTSASASGTKSLGRSSGLSFLRTGDASREDIDWEPESTPNATTLSRNASGRGSIKKPALTKAALLRLSAGEKKADDEEKRRIKNEFGNCPSHSNDGRQKSITPNIMTRSAYDYSTSSHARLNRSQSKTPQIPRRSVSRAGSVGHGGRESISPYNWQQRFKPEAYSSKYQGSYNPIASLHRAEPDGGESESDDDQRKNSLEGNYDHSKEYDPFQTAERQMQELLFGSGGGPTMTYSRSRDCAVPSYTAQSTMKKPQPVRPSATSAFSAYLPNGSPSRQHRGNTPTANNRSYGTAYPNSWNESPRSQAKGYSSDSDFKNNYTNSKLKNKIRDNNDIMSSSDYHEKEGSGALLARANSLRASMSKNWKDIFPSLNRSTQSTESFPKKGISANTNDDEIERAAAKIASEANSLTEDLSKQNQAMARFCHECGNPFEMQHIRFCCKCGVKRLYVF